MNNETYKNTRVWIAAAFINLVGTLALIVTFYNQYDNPAASNSRWYLTPALAAVTFPCLIASIALQKKSTDLASIITVFNSASLIFLITPSLQSFGLGTQTSLSCCALFCCVCISLSKLPSALCLFLSSMINAMIFINADSMQTSPTLFFAVIGGAAFLWRALVFRLLFLSIDGSKAGEEIELLQQNLQQTEQEKDLLRDEIIEHIHKSDEFFEEINHNLQERETPASE